MGRLLAMHLFVVLLMAGALLVGRFLTLCVFFALLAAWALLAGRLFALSRLIVFFPAGAFFTRRLIALCVHFLFLAVVMLLWVRYLLQNRLLTVHILLCTKRGCLSLAAWRLISAVAVGVKRQNDIRGYKTVIFQGGLSPLGIFIKAYA